MISNPEWCCGVRVGCCNGDEVPETLMATIETTRGTYEIALSVDGKESVAGCDGPSWYGSGVVAPEGERDTDDADMTLSLRLCCAAQWQLAWECLGSGNSEFPEFEKCEPFLMSFAPIELSGGRDPETNITISE